jgi:tetratricopeptide (TPR) repeat protein
LRAAIRLDPRLPNAYVRLSTAEDALGHSEAARSAIRKAFALTAPDDPNFGLTRYTLLNLTSDHLAALQAIGSIDYVQGRAEAGPIQAAQLTAVQLALLHNPGAARRAVEQSPAGARTIRTMNDFGLNDWSSAVMDYRAYLAAGVAYRLRGLSGLAIATARLGRVPEAEGLIAQTPIDCSYCLEYRGVIAALRRDWSSADRWFAEAVRQDPSGPGALDDWGLSLVDRGDPQSAIGKFEQAHHAAPHLADPLELWGEALMRTGDEAGAVARFAEADKYAPRWGANHLHWGEALMLYGRYHNARAQYEAANGMDLSKPDRAALDVLLARTASGPLHG